MLGPLALLSMGTIWGLGFALAKLAGENGAHPIGLVLWETIGSGALLLIVCAMLGRYPRRQWTYLRYYLINGLLGFAIPGPILFWIAPHLPVARADPDDPDGAAADLCADPAHAHRTVRRLARAAACCSGSSASA